MSQIKPDRLIPSRRITLTGHVLLISLFFFFYTFAAADEELFEDNPEEYIRRDIEGSGKTFFCNLFCSLEHSTILLIFWSIAW